MSVKVTISYETDAECADMIARLNSPGMIVSKEYRKGAYARKYISWSTKRLDKPEQFRYNGDEQMFAVSDVEKEYPIE